MLRVQSCHVSPRGALFALFVVACILLAGQLPMYAQLCTGTAPPCVLTAGYAGPASDTGFNKRQGINPYETILSPTSLPSGHTGTLFEVDDDAGQLPSGATSNPIMAQPLYVAGITVADPLQGTCSPCDMVIAVTLNGTVFAWIADGSGPGSLLWSGQGYTGSTANPPGNAGNALWYDDCGPSSSPVTYASTVLQFMGIVSTPVIDTSGATPVMFLTSFCKTADPQERWYLHEINLTTGHDVAVNYIGNDVRQTLGHSAFSDGYQWQRSALLEVKNPYNGSTHNLIYVLFGTGVPENAYNYGYAGWVVAYTAGSSGLTPVFAYSDEPTGCGTGGGYVGGSPNGQCNVDPNTGTPPCDCYAGIPQANAPNWGGHGAGCWMSGNGPSATVPSAIESDRDVHVFFGCGNGGFQNAGLGGAASDNFGQTVMDFRLTSSGYDSDITGPFQTFTPNSPAGGLAPPLLGVCGCSGSGTTGCGPCSYTVQTMNAWDYDQAVSGVPLFNDVNGNPRLVTIDKAGYGYLLTQGNLCGAGDNQCTGFASGDPSSWTFGAAATLCSGGPDNCHRVPSIAVTDSQAGSAYWAIYMNYWPNQEQLTALKVSDNSTPQSGAGQLQPDGSLNNALDLAAACTAGENCLPDQVIPGDALTLSGCACAAGAACPPVITSVSTSQIALNMTVATAFGTSCTYPQSFQYTGYFVTPAHDNSHLAPTAGYPGGALTASEDCTSSGCTDQMIWAVVANSSSQPDNTNRGLGTLYAYTALPNAYDILAQDWASTDTWCASSFARPTIVNGGAFVPTYGVSSGSRTFSTCPVPGSSGIPYPSGLLVYHH